MDGILLINKPVGITSFDVVRHAKKVFNTKKIGHTGTLDPFASGLLILCVGKATKLVESFLNSDKTYLATIRFNNHYDTYDVTGTITNTNNKEISKDIFIETLKSFKGEYYQLPPMYSAIKKDGKKLYEYARKGETIEVPKRLVNIIDINYQSEVAPNEFIFETKVSKGTYIRSLAVDIATKLNTYGALSNLVRTEVSNYKLSEATDLNALTVDNLISLEDYFKDEEVIVLNDYMIKLVKNGVYLDERQTDINKNFIVKDEAGNTIAYYVLVDKNSYKPLIIF